MNKNNIILIMLFFTIIQKLYSQENVLKVKYLLEYGIVKNTEFLLVNKNYSKYQNSPLLIEDKRDVIKNNEKNEYTVFQKEIKLDKIETYQYYNNNVIYQKHNKNKENIYIVDTLPKFKWEIKHEERKKIGIYDCIKATTIYRGTKIIAYFTEALPFSFGPWKFGKLPGLILEVYTIEDMMTHRWTAIEVNYPYKSDEVTSFELPKDKKIISMKKYVEENDNELKEINKMNELRNPLGVKSTSVIERLGVEKIYEWEKL
jgi:GLPGLI family protein